MQTINQILRKLDTAVKLANKDTIEERKLAIILFDHLIETQLRRFETLIYNFDKSTFSSKRKYSLKKRENSNRYFKELLKLIKSHNYINKKEYYLIKFCHIEIRNKIYHDFDSINNELVNLGLGIYFHILKNNLSILTYSGPMIALEDPNVGQVDFGQGIKEYDIDEYVIWQNDYQKRAINHILGSVKQDPNIKAIVSNILENKINIIRENIELLNSIISEPDNELNFYSILSKWKGQYSDLFYKCEIKGIKPISLDAILLCYLFFRKYKDAFEDLERSNIVTKSNYVDDPFHNFRLNALNNYMLKYSNEYPHWPKIDEIKRKIAGLSKLTTINDILNLFTTLNNKTENIYKDSCEAILDYHAYCDPSNWK